MNRPSLLTRLMAGRLMSIVLLLACGATGLGCFAGEVSWWLGLLALFMALQTLSAIGQVRRYKAWAVKWQAMAAPVNATPRVLPNDAAGGVGQKASSGTKCRRHGWLRISVAALLALAIPAYVGDSGAPSAALTWLWLAACLYLAFRLVRGTMRRGGRRPEQKAVAAREETEAPFVMWVMDRASSSPSRAEAEHNLPEYSARLLMG